MTNIKNILEQYPLLYVSLLKMKRRGHWSHEWVVSRDTDCVIEGFPRSANSFAHAAFKLSQPESDQLKIATHTHSPAQIIQAVRWKIPTMVCVRRPYDAVRGLLSFNLELKYHETPNQSISNLSLPDFNEVRSTLHRWEFFHRQILPFRNNFFIAPFERITREYDVLSREFIEWSGRDWQSWNPDKVSADQIKEGGFHVGPNELREEIKKSVEQVINSAGLENMLMDCNALYQELVCNEVNFNEIN